MKFSLIALLACAVTAIASPMQLVSRADASRIIVDIQLITTKSGDLNKKAADLNILSFILGGFGFSIASGLQDIGQTGAIAVNDVTTPPFDIFSAPDARDVIAVLKTFVIVHQQLLSTLIGKHGLFEQFGGTQPIAKALREIEEVVDSFAEALINLIPTEYDEAMFQMHSLDISLRNTISVYSD
ncbi:hypothetical protein EXIGLDRAFT_762474 [Exidia glandulosa HHB12029]|uniref:Uncharacterized protein n=1 Tax=Exidia glandulosa HHB12029 TaxID=1314781 RepID=A0A165MQ83_EXIGL|nr:hypothetical protein EXIGLDRAFT_762474 [Exidia glandulosa HHB12029]